MENNEIKIVREVIEWSCCIFIAIALALLARYYIGSPTMVQQKSMYPTLEPGQRLMMNRTSRITNAKYERGDIITFSAPDPIDTIEDINLDYPVAKYTNIPTEKFEKFVYNVLEFNKVSYIKRVIAIEGDLIQIRDGKVYLNGELLSEDYLAENVRTKIVYYNEIVVPEGCVFVMGDNRDESMDSRTFGCIPVDKIEGKLWIRYWPIKKWGKV